MFILEMIKSKYIFVFLGLENTQIWNENLIS